MPARVIEELQRPPQIVALPSRRSVERIGVFLGEDLRRHLVLYLVEYLELAPLRQSGSGEGDPVEEALDACVLAEEERPVHLLEGHREVESFADAHVLERVAAEVEDEADHHAGRLVGLLEKLLDDALPSDCREIVGRRPDARARSRARQSNWSALKASSSTVRSRKYS